jgi:hypothetical protein
MPSPHGSWVSFLYVCNVLFVAIFTAEAVAKLFSFGPTVYFLEWWNRFDWCLWLCRWLWWWLWWWLCWSLCW